MTNSSGAYQTSNTSLACYLITLGFNLNDIDYSQPRFIFTFKESHAQGQEYEHIYIAGKATVDPATYSRVNRKLMRTMKNLSQWGGA